MYEPEELHSTIKLLNVTQTIKTTALQIGFTLTRQYSKTNEGPTILQPRFFSHFFWSNLSRLANFHWWMGQDQVITIFVTEICDIMEWNARNSGRNRHRCTSSTSVLSSLKKKKTNNKDTGNIA